MSKYFCDNPNCECHVEIKSHRQSTLKIPNVISGEIENRTREKYAICTEESYIAKYFCNKCMGVLDALDDATDELICTDDDYSNLISRYN